MRPRHAATLGAILLAATACPRAPAPEAALRASREVAQALSDAWTDYYVRAVDAPGADLDDLEARDKEFAGLMAGYRAAASAYYLALHRRETIPTGRTPDAALADLVAFLRRLDVPLPEVYR